MRVAFIVFFAFVFASCTRPEQKYQKLYFNFDSLITQQLEILENQKVLIQKTASISGNQSSGSTPSDSVSLAKELDIFRQLDAINKPLFKNQYEITEAPDTKSNLTVRTYRAKIKSSVPEVRFYYLNDFSKLKKIESVYLEENTLYYTLRQGVLEFSPEGGVGILLTKVSVKGVQKMILSDSVPFYIQSEFVAQH
jgi:hypothetical protein